MTNRFSLIIRIAVLAAMLPAFSSCDNDDAKWEVGREALGGIEAERARVDEEWSLYRDDLVRSLDLMGAALRFAAGDASVVDRKEIDGHLERIAGVRRDLAALVDEPRETAVDTRLRLRDEFKATRKDVDATLNRLGHNPDEIARWQDAD